VSASYDDIIDLPHPTSARHPRMSMADRAAQFSPFQALVGYGEAIRETARLTGRRVDLTEEEQALLDEKLRLLSGTGEAATFTYFLPDEKRAAGLTSPQWGASRRSTRWRGACCSRTGRPSPSGTSWRSKAGCSGVYYLIIKADIIFVNDIFCYTGIVRGRSE